MLLLDRLEAPVGGFGLELPEQSGLARGVEGADEEPVAVDLLEVLVADRRRVALAALRLDAGTGEAEVLQDVGDEDALLHDGGALGGVAGDGDLAAGAGAEVLLERGDLLVVPGEELLRLVAPAEGLAGEGERGLPVLVVPDRDEGGGDLPELGEDLGVGELPGEDHVRLGGDDLLDVGARHGADEGDLGGLVGEVAGGALLAARGGEADRFDAEGERGVEVHLAEHDDASRVRGHLHGRAGRVGDADGARVRFRRTGRVGGVVARAGGRGQQPRPGEQRREEGRAAGGGARGERVVWHGARSPWEGDGGGSAAGTWGRWTPFSLRTGGFRAASGPPRRPPDGALLRLG
ncbi:putative iron-siderophore uptake ABC transporter substrate-binding protein [Streptomyces sp. Tu6071]|nr:putative iron-siderophore uptake ABC transporter substrate-binding protein [Streptomyces sp. Tu6071]